jgi:hypothetical protein
MVIWVTLQLKFLKKLGLLKYYTFYIDTRMLLCYIQSNEIAIFLLLFKVSS